MSQAAQAQSGEPAGLGWKVILWAAQLLVGVPFTFFGFMKITYPIASLAAMMPWTGELPAAFVRTMGVIDMAGGIGLILPALTRIQPRLTVWAALGCVLLQISAIIFHVARGESAATPLNAIFLALALFILWGRTKKAPFAQGR